MEKETSKTRIKAIKQGQKAVCLGNALLDGHDISKGEGEVQSQMAQTQKIPKLSTCDAKAAQLCEVILKRGPRAGEPCNRKMPCRSHRKPNCMMPQSPCSPGAIANTSPPGLMHWNSVLPMVAPFLAEHVLIPTMKNGRCFAASYALAIAPLSQVRQQLAQRRNDMGCPILHDGTLNRTRHDEEVAESKAIAAKIMRALRVHEEWQETWQGIGYLEEIEESFCDGRVIEEHEVRVIANAMPFCLAVHFDLKEDAPMYINQGAFSQIEMVFQKTSNSGVGHWSPVRYMLAFQFRAVCSTWQALESEQFSVAS